METKTIILAALLYLGYWYLKSVEPIKTLTLFPDDYIVDDNELFRDPAVVEYTKDVPPKWIIEIYDVVGRDKQTLLSVLPTVVKKLKLELERVGSETATSAELSKLKYNVLSVVTK